MFNNIPPITRNIIVINVIVYLVSNFLSYPVLYNLLSAYYPMSPNFHWWQIITHMFMHASFHEGGVGLMHIAFNMFTLFSFGPVLEQTMGTKKYLWLYFLSGIGAFVLFNLWNAYGVYEISQTIASHGINVSEIFQKSALNYTGDQSIFKDPDTLQLGQMLNEKMLGASGAIFGVVAAFATLYPDAKLMIMFIPVPIKAKYLLPVVIIGSIYLGFSGNDGGVAHFAHVGGALVGILVALRWKKNRFRIN